MDEPEELHDVELVDELAELDEDWLTEWEREFRASLEEKMTREGYTLSDRQRDRAIRIVRQCRR